MSRRYYRLISSFLIIITIFVAITEFTAIANIIVPEAKPDTYVYDDDDILGAAVVKKLNDMLISLEKATEVEFAVITIKSLNGYSIEDYSIKVANTLGVGKRGKDNGIVLIMSRSDTKVRLEIAEGLGGVLNDSKVGRILDKYFVPHRAKDDYVQATELTVQAVINIVAEDMGVSIEGVDTSINVESSIDSQLLIIAIIFVLALILFFMDDSGGYYGGSFRGTSFGGRGSSGSSFGGGSFRGGGSSR